MGSLRQLKGLGGRQDTNDCSPDSSSLVVRAEEGSGLRGGRVGKMPATLTWLQPNHQRLFGES